MISAGVPILLLTACVSEAERRAKGPLPRLDRLFPEKVVVGQAFHVQKNGQSALGATGGFFQKGIRLLINGHPLDTTLTDENTLSALVPVNFIQKEGTYAIHADMPDGRMSNALPLIVLPVSGPAPVLSKLYPDTTAAGQGFNLQSDGQSAMGLTGSNFLPGVKVLVNGDPMETNFGDIDRLSCFFAAKHFQRPGRVKVTVRNPDGKESAPVEFLVK